MGDWATSQAGKAARAAESLAWDERLLWNRPPPETMDVRPPPVLTRAQDALEDAELLTPLCFVAMCGPGDRELPGWFAESRSPKLHGLGRRCMAKTMAKLLEACTDTPIGVPVHDSLVSTVRRKLGWDTGEEPPPRATEQQTLRVLSLCDGSRTSDHVVPTTVMLAHVLADPELDTLLGKPLAGAAAKTQVHLYGADAANVTSGNVQELSEEQQARHVPGWRPPGVPPRVSLHNLRLDASAPDFTQQLTGQDGAEEIYYDVVLLRQGLRFDDEISDGARVPDIVEIRGCSGNEEVSGVYTLEKDYNPKRVRLAELKAKGRKRPIYRRESEDSTLRYDSLHSAWVVRWPDPPDDTPQKPRLNNIYAGLRSTATHPAAVWGAWEAWDGGEFVGQPDMRCVSVRPPHSGLTLWKQPSERVSRCGVNCTPEAIANLCLQVVSVLNFENRNAYAWLHSSCLMGPVKEVRPMLQAARQGVARFNVSPDRGYWWAVLLRREHAPPQFAFDGIFLAML